MVTKINVLKKRSSNVTLSDSHPEKTCFFSALEKLLAVGVLALIYTLPYHSVGSVCRRWKGCRYLPSSLYTVPG